jgi:hypothetical protein
VSAYDKLAELDRQLRPIGLLGVYDFGLQHRLFRITGYTREQIANAVSVNDEAESVKDRRRKP